MGVIETGVELYYTFFKISIIFSFLLTIFLSVFTFVDLSRLPLIEWEIADLSTAISGLANAKGLDMAVAIPMMIVKVFALLIQSFINSILLINWVITTLINMLLTILPLSESMSLILSNIISWIILLPALIGIISDIGRVVFYLLFGVKR